MSVIGISPTDLVNGVVAVKRIIDSLKEDNGSGERVAKASTSIGHDLAALESLKKALETLSNDNPSSATEVRERLRHLREFQASRLARLSKYDTASTKATTRKQKVKRGYKKLAWEFSGQKELAESNALIASASSAVHLDAIVLTGECTQAEVAKLEPLITSQLDTIKEQLQAGQSEYAEGTRQILDCISRSQQDLSNLVKAMHTVLETNIKSQDLDAGDTRRAPLTIVKAPLPPLNTRIDVRKVMSLWDGLPLPNHGQFRVLPEPLITPILVAVLSRLTMQPRQYASESPSPCNERPGSRNSDLLRPTNILADDHLARSATLSAWG